LITAKDLKKKVPKIAYNNNIFSEAFANASHFKKQSIYSTIVSYA
jgi:hypothetical protein